MMGRRVVWMGLLCGCELLGPPPEDTGPRWVTAGSSGRLGPSTSEEGAGPGRSSSESRASSRATSRPPYNPDAGVCPEWCSTARGYHCEFGDCVLNGSGGPIQVTLDWAANPRAREDLDLHLVTPGGCEIYYGNKDCGTGSLDLDQNASCSQTDNMGGVGNDIENIIYEPGVEPPHGNYTVWVVDWSDRCDGNDPDPFYYTVTVRYHGQVHTFSGAFRQGSSVGGGAVDGQSQNSGQVIIHQFTY